MNGHRRLLGLHKGDYVTIIGDEIWYVDDRDVRGINVILTLVHPGTDDNQWLEITVDQSGTEATFRWGSE